ncbi:MAG: hypothetical protein D6717_06820 [Gammaproteobacteria bacterium]|nr:MAG: hypothetical protein D6717_06820 [Gammaproteobacteria bacterium]
MSTLCGACPGCKDTCRLEAESPRAVRVVFMPAILDAICRVSGYTTARLLTGKGPTCQGLRWLFIVLAREYTPSSWPEIAEQLGYADHSSAMHGARRWQQLRQEPYWQAVEQQVRMLLERGHDG